MSWVVTQLSISTGAGAFDAIAAGPSEGHPALLHGFPQTGLVWQRQIEASAAHGYRVVALDQRGYSPGAHPQRPEDIASAFPRRRGHDHRGTGLGGIRPSAMTEIDRRAAHLGWQCRGALFRPGRRSVRGGLPARRRPVARRARRGRRRECIRLVTEHYRLQCPTVVGADGRTPSATRGRARPAGRRPGSRPAGMSGVVCCVLSAWPGLLLLG
ncbi:alpha/beta fold hydrolase [Streptomyces collinus]